jgi:glucose-1-phosphatase
MRFPEEIPLVKAVYPAGLLIEGRLMTEHVIFDLGQVLIPFDWQIAISRLVPHLKPEVSDIVNGNKAAFVSLIAEPATDLETGNIDFEAFQKRVQAILGSNLNSREFHRIWCDIFRADWDMIALGRALSLRFGTWLASNTSEAHYQWVLEHFPEVQFFRKAALSYELGVMKPDARFFEKALRSFGIDAKNAVFTDDIQENVDGAVAVGMTGILFRNRAQLETELEAL